MKRFLALAISAVGLSTISLAGTYFYEGDLTAGSPTYTNPGGDAGPHAYGVLQFTVNTTGAYNFEAASVNTATAGSNALDTFLALYTGSFNAAAPGAPTAFDDDWTGAFVVLPGPFTIGASGTGFAGALPASQMLAVNLTAGTNYYLVSTSFRATTYAGAGTNGLGLGHYYVGIGGPGDIQAVPEPATMAALGLGAVALLRRRKKA